MVRDEADIIAATVGRMLTQVDRVIVADNMSTDETSSILWDLAASHPELTVLTDHEVAYSQSEKMTRLAHFAREQGAEWVVPFDADEVWYSPFGRIADVLAKFPDCAVAPARLYDHVATAADPVGGDPVVRLGWRRREPGGLPKVACRVSADLVIEMGNHGCHYGPFHGREIPGQLVVRHFPYRSVEQMTRKAVQGAAALDAAGAPPQHGKHWRDYAALEAGSPGAIGEVFHTWFWSADPRASAELIFDPCP
jgi:glycosyltransferase involved in cell wall biosynthesis